MKAMVYKQKGPVPTKFSYNKEEKDKIRERGKKLRLIEILLIVAILAITVGCGFMGYWAFKYDISVWYALLGRILCIVLPVASLALLLIPLKNVKSDPEKAMAFLFAVRGEKSIAEAEAEINKELEKMKQKTQQSNKARKKKYRPKK